MKLSGYVMAVLAAGLISLGGCATGGKDGATRSLPIVAEGNADVSSLTAPEVFLVNSNDELNRRGLSQFQGFASLGSQTLVVLALGERPSGGYSAKITGVQTDGTNVYVQGQARRPGPDETVTQAITHPVYMVVVPKVTGQVRAEIDSVVGSAEATVDMDVMQAADAAAQDAAESAEQARPAIDADIIEIKAEQID